ncbi:MAG: SDR family NAD(P)-dependent oxidoreductase, partial [Planctomycetes bacterium]|nr:SDR family NAD(P)-dependent oxidoreductase [Planctomycetota bacterium]
MSDVSQRVVVITGASSGIGRQTALDFARESAALVLAARDEVALGEVAEECRRLGGRAIVVPTDVTREEQVQALSRRAVEEFGRFDVWINNAAVTLFARFEESPPEDFRRVIDTNLFGYVHGARAALAEFRRQGRGVLINVASVVGKVGQPFTSAYVTSKFAIVGFSECLRQELRDTEIDVVTILPASIDTPLFQHGANYTGQAIEPLKPVYEAEVVSREILAAARHPRREVYAGAAGRLAGWMHRLAPGLAEKFVGRQ